MRQTPGAIAARDPADIRWEWINKAALAGLERSRAADARALERMEQGNV